VAELFPPALSELIRALQALPGVGPKSAQRAAFHLLERDREGMNRLAGSLERAATDIRHCERCRMFAVDRLCTLCANPGRNERELVVVESPADVAAIEAATSFHGRYFVLMGRLSPLDGIGPGQLGGHVLEARLGGEVEEVIVATGATVEGEATAHWIGELARLHGVRASRIAHGVPVGGDLEYVDGNTLARAFAGRRGVDESGG